MKSLFVLLAVSVMTCSCAAAQNALNAPAGQSPDTYALSDQDNDRQVMKNIKKLSRLLSDIEKYDKNNAGSWKIVPAAKEAFELMKDGLPLRVEGELTPYKRIVLLNDLIDCLPERNCARFLLSVKEYQMSMFPLIVDGDIAVDIKADEYDGDPARFVRAVKPDDVRKSLKRTEDFLNPRISVQKWCREYGVRLRFDPVERSEEWENVICEVERECDELLKGEKIVMGYVYRYWSTKKDILAKHGIEWSNPSEMNPGVIFD